MKEMMMEIKYENLLEEANEILQSLEKDSLSIDEISSSIEKAYGIIDLLKSKLFATEAQVNEIVNARNSN
jgi:exodeoxyribonuclease VII small subunit